MTQTYNDIEHKGGLTHLRVRPEMYVGSCQENSYTSALMNLLREVVGNSADEFANGHATDIWIELTQDQNRISVLDNGRGIPFGLTVIDNPFVEGQKIEIDKLELATSIPNTGAKYQKGEGKAFVFSIGLNGIGVKAVNALSDEFHVSVYRPEGARYLSYRKGVSDTPICEIPFRYLPHQHESPPSAPVLMKSGTEVCWIPDLTIIPFIYSVSHISRFLKETAYLNAGLRIHFTLIEGDNRSYTQLYEPDGIHAFLRDQLGKEKPLMLFDALSETDPNTGNQYEIALAITEGSGESFHPFVNGSSIESVSTPVVALRQSFARALATFVKDHYTLPKKYTKIDLRPEDFRSGLMAIIKILHINPSFDSQTKTKLTNTDIATFIATTLPNAILAQLLSHPTEAARVVSQVLVQAEARIAAQKAREQITKAPKKACEDVAVSLNIYTAPLTHDPSINSLYLFEGESASGSLVKAAKARDPLTGKLYKERIGILALKGVVLNTLELDITRALKNTELATLIRVSGLNPKDPDDLSGLNFRDFIIATDEDAGGALISTLLITFFLTLFPEIIRQGRLYRVRTPLFELIDLKTRDRKFIYSDEDKDTRISQMGYHPSQVNITYTLKRNKGLGEQSDPCKMTLVENPRLTQILYPDVEEMRKLFLVFSGKDYVQHRRELIFSRPFHNRIAFSAFPIL